MVKQVIDLRSTTGDNFATLLNKASAEVAAGKVVSSKGRVVTKQGRVWTLITDIIALVLRGKIERTNKPHLTAKKIEELLKKRKAEIPTDAAELKTFKDSLEVILHKTLHIDPSTKKVDEKFTKKQKEIDKILASFDRIIKLAEPNPEPSDLEKKVAEQEAAIKNLQEEKTALENKQQADQARFADVEKKSADLTKQIEDLKAAPGNEVKIKELEVELEKATKDKDEFKKLADEGKLKQDELKNNLEKAEKELDAAKLAVAEAAKKKAEEEEATKNAQELAQKAAAEAKAKELKTAEEEVTAANVDSLAANGNLEKAQIDADNAAAALVDADNAAAALAKAKEGREPKLGALETQTKNYQPCYDFEMATEVEKASKEALEKAQDAYKKAKELFGKADADCIKTQELRTKAADADKANSNVGTQKALDDAIGAYDAALLVYNEAKNARGVAKNERKAAKQADHESADKLKIAGDALGAAAIPYQAAEDADKGFKDIVDAAVLADTKAKEELALRTAEAQKAKEAVEAATKKVADLKAAGV